MTSKLPDVKAAVEAAREDILSGSLVVCDALVDPEAANEPCAGLK
jgi:hypothetical protein